MKDIKNCFTNSYKCGINARQTDLPVSNIHDISLIVTTV